MSGSSTPAGPIRRLPSLRTLIFWPHLIAGVSAGLVILLMCVTGVLLTYERQMIAWSDSHFRSLAPSPGAEPLEAETLLAKIREQHPESVPTAVTVAADPTAPVSVALGPRTLLVDAYTGDVLGESSQAVRRVMSELRAWHRWISIDGDNRAVARAITGWSNFIFLFMVVSGFYLWLPRRWTWKHLRPGLWFTGKLRGKARDFNWHNVIGVWSAVPLFIVVVSAVPISFRWASDLVYVAAGETPPAAGGRGGAGGREGGPSGPRAGGVGRDDARQGGAARRAGSETLPPHALVQEGVGDRGHERREPGDGRHAADAPFAGLNALWTRAERQVPGWRTMNLRIPESAGAPIVFAIDKGDGGQPHLRSTLTLNRQSGDVISYESFSSLTVGRRIRNVMRFAHTGEVLGIPGQTIAGLVSVGGAVLVWTGIALALRRFVASTKRRRAAQAADADARKSTAA